MLYIKSLTKENYDILLCSNIFDYTYMTSIEFVKALKKFDIPQIQACYDWFGLHREDFVNMGCQVNRVLPSAPSQYNKKLNYVYSLKK